MKSFVLAALAACTSAHIASETVTLSAATIGLDSCEYSFEFSLAGDVITQVI